MTTSTSTSTTPTPERERNLSPMNKTYPGLNQKVEKRTGGTSSARKRVKLSHPTSLDTLSKTLFRESNGEDDGIRKRKQWRETNDECDDEEDNLPLWRLQQTKDYFASVSRHVNDLNNKEDDEEVMYAVRAKLFEFVSEKEADEGRWIERGVGMMKFLKHLEEGITYGTVRLTMYRDGTLQQLINHLVEPVIQVNSKKGGKDRKIYVWNALDTNERMRTFAARFGKEHEALEWKSYFEEAKRLTRQARMGFDNPDTSAGEEASDYFKALTTTEKEVTTPKTKKVIRERASL